jgi:hypothetical protein
MQQTTGINSLRAAVCNRARDGRNTYAAANVVMNVTAQSVRSSFIYVL